MGPPWLGEGSTAPQYCADAYRGAYRGTSLIRNTPPVGPHSSPTPRDLGTGIEAGPSRTRSSHNLAINPSEAGLQGYLAHKKQGYLAHKKQGYLAHKKQGYLAHKKQGYLAHKKQGYLAHEKRRGTSLIRNRGTSLRRNTVHVLQGLLLR